MEIKARCSHTHLPHSGGEAGEGGIHKSPPLSEFKASSGDMRPRSQTRTKQVETETVLCTPSLPLSVAVAVIAADTGSPAVGWKCLRDRLLTHLWIFLFLMRRTLRTVFVLRGVMTKSTAECSWDCFLPRALVSHLIFMRHLRGGW